MKRPTARRRMLIAEPRQIRALASPIRQDILDTVMAIGPCSVADVARALGRRADGLYYHIRRLIAVRLLVGMGEGELQLDVPKKSMYLVYDPSDPRNRAAVLRVISALLRSAGRTFRKGFRPGVAVVSGPRRNLWAGRQRGALSPRELEEMNRLIVRLVELMQSGRHDAPGRGGRKRRIYELSFVIAPVTRKS